MVLVSLNEVLVVVGTAIILLLFATKFGLIRRSYDRFLQEFRKSLHGSNKEAHHREKAAQSNRDDEICYQLLGVTPSASREEIREAYCRKAKQYHPDKGGDPDMMRALTEAYKKVSKRR